MSHILFGIFIDNLRKEIADDSYESIVRIERGGEITWHGPGMLMLYPILTRYEKSLRWYVTALEEVIIKTVANFGIRAHRSTVNNGVWVKLIPPSYITII